MVHERASPIEGQQARGLKPPELETDTLRITIASNHMSR
jgi:hypothetical protein